MPAQVQSRANNPGAVGQLKRVWFGVIEICQSSGDSIEAKRPAGISGKNSESISAPKRLELWQEATGIQGEGGREGRGGCSSFDAF